MDDVITSIVHISFVGVFLEIAHVSHQATIGTQEIDGVMNREFWIEGGYILLISYVLCLLTQLFGFKNVKSITTSPVFRSTLSFLHGLDGLAAMVIGTSIYFKSKTGLWIGSIMITKVFLIHLLNRLILAKKSDLGMFAECTQTTKSFLHHVSSFLFISHPAEIIITTIWRTISMTGHATLVLRGKVSSLTISRINWGLAYMRIFMVVLVLYFCLTNDDISGAFGKSAIGHISYMMVRAGPVYKTGSMYLDEKEKEHWISCTDDQKIVYLITGKYLILSLELALLLILSGILLTLRIAFLVAIL